MNFLPYFIFGCLFVGWLCLFAWAVDYSLEGNSRWRKVPALLMGVMMVAVAAFASDTAKAAELPTFVVAYSSDEGEAMGDKVLHQVGRGTERRVR